MRASEFGSKVSQVIRFEAGLTYTIKAQIRLKGLRAFIIDIKNQMCGIATCKEEGLLEPGNEKWPYDDSKLHSFALSFPCTSTGSYALTIQVDKYQDPGGE